MTASLDAMLRAHLAREDGQDDLCFALWHPSEGATRFTPLLRSAVLPGAGDRVIHGNAEFLPTYFERAIGAARRAGAGLAFLHSHPGRGWQGVSSDDIAAEEGNAAAALAATGLPLVGLTLAARDGTWSARVWCRREGRSFGRVPCESVRVIGERLRVSYDPVQRPAPRRRPELARTIDAWGPTAQADLARLRVGVIGAGSVGSIVLEGLARMGVQHVVALDFDSIEQRNRDRSLHVRAGDVGLAKVAVAARELLASATTEDFVIEPYETSICEDAGYRAALDCDVLFSCVDRPWPRSVLNFIAYAHLIPVIDGGISVSRTARQTMRGADWKAHVATHGHRCLECVGQYEPGYVQADREGYLDDPRYIERLPEDHALRANENVFAFSLAVASLELLQLIQLIVGPSGIGTRWAQTYHFPAGVINLDGRACEDGCVYPALEARGEQAGHPGTGPDLAAEHERHRRYLRAPRQKLDTTARSPTSRRRRR